MFIINCPFVENVNKVEFKAGGEAHLVRPKQPTELSDDHGQNIYS
jgi:sarcosine oxidase delta subunit